MHRARVQPLLTLVGPALVWQMTPGTIAGGVVLLLLGPWIFHTYYTLREVAEEDGHFMVRNWTREERIPCAALTACEIPRNSARATVIGTLHFGPRKVRFLCPADLAPLVARLEAHLARNGIEPKARR